MQSCRADATTAFTMVRSNEELAPLLELLAAPCDAPVALDTEADSMHHYREKLCLIQLSTGDRHWIIDPLAQVDLTPFFTVLERQPLILHGADYDLRLLHRFHHFRPCRVFDTMIAAQLLGIQQFGLAALVERYCGVVLSKDCQRADWSVRPLPAELLAYAVDDTRHLATVAGRMREELIERNRLEWHEEACARQIGIASANRPERDGEAWRLKGGKHLRGRAAAVLRELWMWREDLACKLDRPPFKVAGNDLLLKFALFIDEHPRATFDATPERPAWLRGSRLQGFDHALQRALNLPPSKWPGAPVNHKGGIRLSRQQEALLARMLAVRDSVAEGLQLDPGVLAPRDTVKFLLRDKPESTEALYKASPLMQWQVDALVPALMPLIRESASLPDEDLPAD